MSTPRFARGSKSRLFLYIGAITVAGMVVYFFHRAQRELYDYQRKSEKCLQQQESLSAQFQVIIEYKVRLEKSLQQEKSEHRRLREELQGKLDEEKQLREKENLENINKFTSLQQQHKILQSHHEDLTEEYDRLRMTQLQGLDARSKLESALEEAKQEVQNVQQAKDKEMENLKNQFLRMEVENEKLQKQNKELTENGKDHNSNMNHLEKEVIQLNQALQTLQGELGRCEAHSSSPVQVGVGVGNAPKVSALPKPSSSPVAVAPNLLAQVLPEPQHDHDEKAPHTLQKSTTPQINPDAVLSREKAVNAVGAVAAPDTVAKEPTPSNAAGSSRKEVGAGGESALQALQGVGPAPPAAAPAPLVPAGVVPAPHGYGLEARDEQVAAAHGMNEDAGVAQDPWHWRRSKAWAAPVMGAVGEAPRRRLGAHGMPGNMAGAEGVDEAEEREKEIPRQLHNPYGEYNGDNGEYEKEHHGDLQLEEGEEEEDDDVDQIDYANENANGADARQKRVNLKDPIPNVNKHDSVMVNPK